MRDVFPSLRGVFGSWVYYSVVMQPEQINRLVLQCHEIRESESLDDYLQRGLTSNLGKMKKYLAEREDRFFNSIIVGVFDDIPDWSSLNLESVDFLGDQRGDIEDSIGLLRFSGGEKLFAIDGQHRIEAIKANYLKDTDYDDQVSVIFVAHVDSAKGKKRTRRLFSDINKKAQRVSAGELVIIDEEEIENIVARKVFAKLESKYPGAVAVTKAATVRKTDRYLFNLISIAKVVSHISRHLGLRKACDPSDSNVELVLSLTLKYFELILSGEVVQAVRDSRIKELREDELHILCRPIGQEIMAMVFVKCIELRGLTSLRKWFGSIDYSMESIYFQDVVYKRKKIEPKYTKLSRDLILYALGVINKREISVPEGFEDNFLDGKLVRLK